MHTTRIKELVLHKIIFSLQSDSISIPLNRFTETKAFYFSNQSCPCIKTIDLLKRNYLGKMISDPLEDQWILVLVTPLPTMS